MSHSDMELLFILGLKMTCPHLHHEREQKVHESYINGFSYKDVFLSGKTEGIYIKIKNPY